MKRTLLFAALLAGSVLAPGLASADTMSAKDSMDGTTMVCRVVKSDAKSNAMTATKEPLMCKAVDMKKMPEMSGMKTAADADKAWRQFWQIQMNSL